MNELFVKVKNNCSTFGWFILKLAIVAFVLYNVGYIFREIYS